jgi:hypothetical protein
LHGNMNQSEWRHVGTPFLFTYLTLRKNRGFYRVNARQSVAG